MKKLNLSPNLNGHFEWEFLSSSFPNAGMSIIERYYDVGKKNHYKNGLASQMISHYLANVLLLLYQFFSLFHVMLQLRGNWEHTVYNFKKGLSRINISPWKWKLCVNIYAIEFESIHWMRPMEGCFLYTESQQDRRKI